MSGSIRTPGFEAVLVTLAAFREGEESNNSTWGDIRIRNGRAKVVGYGPT